MKPYVFSLLAGVLAGAIYGAIGVNSPAPPIIALTGLLGMLAGEQILPVARRMLAGHRLHAAWRDAKCSQHMFGALPGGSTHERKPS
ncbi:XapX domain-containing protein [Burkholderia sp. SR8]|jgi:XapX domain-containing protein|uniref:XapX domain-containing protein n=1 Tax=Burkholderia sp. SR8 TaxID=3062277 RepID=UPI0040637035